MNYRECPHYNELLHVLAEKKDWEDISFELDDTQNCKECSKGDGICSLWLNLTFVDNMRPQLSIPEAELTIDNLDENFGFIVRELVRIAGSKKENEDKKD